MSYTLSSVRQRVLEDKLDDTEFDPGIVDRFINDTQRSVFNTYELPFAEKVFQGTMAAGGTVYTFPSDYQLQQSLVVIDPEGNKLDITDKYMPFRAFNSQFPAPSLNNAAPPDTWTLHGNKIYFSHPLDVTYTLSLFYLKKADKLEDDADVPEIPEEFEEVLVIGAYYRILERNEDLDLANWYKNNDYTEELEKMVERLGKRQSGKTHQMAQPMRGVPRRRGRV